MADNVPDDRLALDWGPWLPLEGCWHGTMVVQQPGLYRVRRADRADLDYIGQTGDLRSRLGMLRGVYATEMPYRDPHTAAPALWALRHTTREVLFQVSVAPVEGPLPWRKGMEALAIARHRQEHGRSPTVEFGRMPVGYQTSTGNNAKLIAAGNRRRGGTGGAADAGARGLLGGR